MKDTIQIGGLAIHVTRKNIKNIHLSVHPPTGRVTLSAPKATRLDVARAYAISKLTWIRRQRESLRHQARESPRSMVELESHYLWGRRHLLSVKYRDAKPEVVIDHRRITIFSRPSSDTEKRRRILHDWHKSLLHEAVPPIIRRWEEKLGVRVDAYFLQRMKTKWGGCNYRKRRIRLNTELVKKPKDLLEYVIVHEMAHMLEPTHSERFVALLNKHYPSWREARNELNALPLAAEEWLR